MPDGETPANEATETVATAQPNDPATATTTGAPEANPTPGPDSSASHPAIEATGLSHAFGDVRVLEDVSLSVAPGEIVALVGPNGSGKSTLLRFLAKVRAPDEGTVTIGEAGETRVGYLPQQPGFRSGFSAEDTLQFYAQFVDDEIDVPDILDRVGLSGAANRRVEALSGGMTRLLGLGRALVGDPDALVLDEPASGLDPGMVERLFGIVSDLAADGTAIILSSHNLGPVERTADRVVVLDDGRFVADAPPREIVESAGAADLQTAFGTLVSTDGVDGR
ncbi:MULTISPECIES: ABC transporter ATP-binding protein [Haloferax]|uniref:ATP-binding cassette domain-containing protein n=1 Tax=Haloferax marinum TaxID=2666143 RepID=A0A6A8G6Y7_9EURY|nr:MULTISPECIES: ABC transporter ATP-binding protein [Haloferax]KAB1196880.1 ABC transporter ATP-binding protein [Haloferax sp. CBA1150]MRW95896.1 ATP-binding cassette domain-containing protein [Haloferax marinum]